MKRITGVLLLLVAATALADSPSAPDSNADKPGPAARANRSYSSDVAPLTWSSEAEMNHYFVFRFVHTIGNGADRMPPMYMSANDLMRLVPEDNSTPNVNPASGDSNSTKQTDAKSADHAENGTVSTAANPQPEAYRIDSLELVGIAKHNQPVAYNQKSLRFADKYANRQLTDFEAKAVGELQSGKELVVESDGGTRRVVGAIRAGKSCLECHDSFKQGDLLGAFSYQLASAKPIDAAAVKDPLALRGVQTNQRALQQGTVLGRLEQARMALQSAADSLDKATTAEHGSDLKKLSAAIDRAEAKVAAMMDYVDEHPDTNCIGSGRKGAAISLLIRMPKYATFWQLGMNADAEFNGIGFPGVEPKTASLSAENEHGVRIDQDGKGISAPAANAILYLQSAQLQFYGPQGIAGSESNGLGSYRDAILKEILSAADSAKLVLDHVHETVHAAPTAVKSAGPGVRASDEAGKESATPAK